MNIGAFDVPARDADASTWLKFRMKLDIALTNLQHATIHLRFVASLLAGSMIFDLLDPVLILGSRMDTLVFKAAESTRLGATGLAVVFLVLAAGLVPFLANQLGCWPHLRRAVTKCACATLALAGLLWFFLWWRCLNLDLGLPIQIVFARSGAGALLFAVALGLSLNAELLRRHMERQP